jgi:cholesterol transport system auxiliary component
MTRRSWLLAAMMLPALSGCISFGAKPPPTLMTLTATQTRPAERSRTAAASEAVTVVAPTVPQELMTTRVPVRSSPTELSYLKNAQWVEMPSTLFGRLLSETIAATTGRVVLDPKQFTFDPGRRLTGQLQAFGLDATRNEAVAVYDAAMARGADRVETRRFEVRVPVAAIDPASARQALNDAANRLAAEVAAWVG